MRSLIFSPLAGQDYLAALDFVPTQATNLGLTLAGQKQQLDDIAVVIISAGVPDGSDLGIGKHSFPRLFFTWLRIAGDIALRQLDALADYPAQKRAEAGTHSVAGYRMFFGNVSEKAGYAALGHSADR